MGGGAQMRLQIRVIRDDGTECIIEGIARDDWNSLHDRCPECGNREFDHFRASGGHYGPNENTVVERSDFWDAKLPLYTRCRSCREILYKHPAFELLYSVGDNDDVVLEFE